MERLAGLCSGEEGEQGQVDACRGTPHPPAHGIGLSDLEVQCRRSSGGQGEACEGRCALESCFTLCGVDSVEIDVR